LEGLTKRKKNSGENRVGKLYFISNDRGPVKKGGLRGRDKKKNQKTVLIGSSTSTTFTSDPWGEGELEKMLLKER